MDEQVTELQSDKVWHLYIIESVFLLSVWYLNSTVLSRQAKFPFFLVCSNVKLFSGQSNHVLRTTFCLEQCCIYTFLAFVVLLTGQELSFLLSDFSLQVSYGKHQVCWHKDTCAHWDNIQQRKNEPKWLFPGHDARLCSISLKGNPGATYKTLLYRTRNVQYEQADESKCVTQISVHVLT